MILTINDIQKFKLLPIYSAAVFIGSLADYVVLENIHSSASSWEFTPIESSNKDLNGNSKIIAYRFSGEISCIENFITDLEYLYSANHEDSFVSIGLGEKNTYNQTPSKKIIIGNPVSNNYTSRVRVRMSSDDNTKHIITFETILSADIVTDTAKFNQFFLNQY